MPFRAPASLMGMCCISAVEDVMSAIREVTRKRRGRQSRHSLMTRCLLAPPLPSAPAIRDGLRQLAPGIPGPASERRSP